MNRTVVIVGLSFQGLALLQLFCDAGYDVQPLALPYELELKPLFASRYLKGKKVRVFSELDELEQLLLEIQNKSDKKLIVILTSAGVVSTIPAAKPYLWDIYDVMAGPCSAIIKLSNKLYVYRHFYGHKYEGIKYCLVSDYCQQTNMRFPIILKRNVELPHLYQYKYQEFYSSEELENFIDKIPNDFKKDLILQEKIDGECEDLDMRGYACKGQIIGYSIVKEIRSFPAGVPSYLEEVSDRELLDKIDLKVSSLIREVKYTGFFGIDIKYDLVSGDLHILDINSRPPASVSSWLYKYSKEDRLHFARNITSPSILPVGKIIRWTNVIRDLKARQESHNYSDLYKVVTASKDLKWPGDMAPYYLSYFYFLRNFFYRFLKITKIFSIEVVKCY